MNLGWLVRVLMLMKGRCCVFHAATKQMGVFMHGAIDYEYFYINGWEWWLATCVNVICSYSWSWSKKYKKEIVLKYLHRNLAILFSPIHIHSTICILQAWISRLAFHSRDECKTQKRLQKELKPKLWQSVIFPKLLNSC